QLGGFGGERAVFGRQLAGGLQVAFDAAQLPGRLDDGSQLGVALAQPARRILVGVHGRVGQLAFDLGVFADQLVEVHGVVSLAGRAARRTPSGPGTRSPPAAGVVCLEIWISAVTSWRRSACRNAARS